MKMTKMKGTELTLSNICYGAGNFGEKLSREQAFAALDKFVDAGGTFIDTANVYCRWVPGCGNSSEQYIGEWLKSRNAYGRVVVATKGGHYDFNCPHISRVTKQDIAQDLEESMGTLGMDHIDLYWLHRDNPHMEIGEIMEIMEEFVKAGKIRYYGASNYSLDRMETARIYAEQKGMQGFSAVSNQWSMASVNKGKNLNTDPSLVILDQAYYQWHKEHQMPLVPFSSSAHGVFDKLYASGVRARNGVIVEGKERISLSEAMAAAYLNPRNFKLYEKLCDVKKEYGVSLYCLTTACLLNQPFQVFPVASVSRLEQMDDFLEASELQVNPELMKALERYEVE